MYLNPSSQLYFYYSFNPPPPPTVTLTADPNPVSYLSAATLTWSSTNADSCSASNGWSGAKATSGSEATGAITSTQTYTLTCSGAGGSTSSSVTVTNPPPPGNPQNSCSADGKTATISWTAPSGYSQFYLRVRKPDGSWQKYDDNYGQTSYSWSATAGASYDWWVHTRHSNSSYSNAAGAGPISCTPSSVAATLSANPANVSKNGSSTLSWTVTNASSATITSSPNDSKFRNRSVGNGPDSDTTSGLQSDTTYTLTAEGYGGPVTRQVTVTVNNQAPVAAASISKDGSNYSGSMTVVHGQSTSIWLSAAGSSDPDGWTDSRYGVSTGGGKCEWNYDLEQGNSPNYEIRVNNPGSVAACSGFSENGRSKTFNDSPGTYTYKVLKITDKPGAVSGVPTVQVTVVAQVSANLTADSTNLAYNGSTTLRWTVANASSAEITSSPVDSRFNRYAVSNGSGSRTTSNLTQTTTYTLTAQGPGGPVVSFVTVNVGARPPTGGPPTPVSVTPVPCGQATITWTDQSTNETGFYLYRSTKSSPSFKGDYTLIKTTASTSVGSTGTGYSYVDSAVTPNQTYSYAITAYNAGGESGAAFTGPTVIAACAPNLSSSTKRTSDMSINGTPYTGQTIKNGDTINFTIVIRNSGNATAQNISVVDTLSANLTNPRNFKLKKGSSPTQNLSPSVSGQVITFSGLGDKAPDQEDGITWLLSFDAKVQTTTSQAVEFAQNSAVITYTGGSANVGTGLFPVRTGKVRVPNIKEIAP